jgi:splicing factor 3A subunit 3
LHDYLWFLQNMDKFDDFPLSRKFKHQAKYTAYLNNLFNYLSSFIKRSRPLFDLEGLLTSFDPIFEERYKEGKIPGWDHNS